MKILGIESSCDETACAIIRQDGEILANIISSQASIHASHGGVVPEVAAREHLSAMRPVIEQALKQDYPLIKSMVLLQQVGLD